MSSYRLKGIKSISGEAYIQHQSIENIPIRQDNIICLQPEDMVYKHTETKKPTCVLSINENGYPQFLIIGEYQINSLSLRIIVIDMYNEAIIYDGIPFPFITGKIVPKHISFVPSLRILILQPTTYNQPLIAHLGQNSSNQSVKTHRFFTSLYKLAHLSSIKKIDLICIRNQQGKTENENESFYALKVGYADNNIGIYHLNILSNPFFQIDDNYFREEKLINTNAIDTFLTKNIAFENEFFTNHSRDDGKELWETKYVQNVFDNDILLTIPHQIVIPNSKSQIFCIIIEQNGNTSLLKFYTVLPESK